MQMSMQLHDFGTVKDFPIVTGVRLHENKVDLNAEAKTKISAPTGNRSWAANP
jgi:hypothetical protein